MRRLGLFVFVSAISVGLAGCITTSMKGYADRSLPDASPRQIATLISAPTALANSLQAAISREAHNRGIISRDVLEILPPTRSYNDQEIRSALSREKIDAVLIVDIGDSGVRKEYAGSFFSGTYSGGAGFGTISGSSTPDYSYHRQTAFKARLLEASSGRTLWVGGGQVQAGGVLFIGDGANANSTAAAIFDDLQRKGVLRASPAA